MRRPLGEMLLKRGAIRRAQLELALARQKSTRQRLGSILVEMGFVSEPDVLAALAEAQNLPSVDLGFARISMRDVVRIPETLARAKRALPFGVFEGRLQVAMVAAHDRSLIEELSRVVGMPIDPHIALEADLDRALEEAYQALRERAAEWVGPRATQPGKFSDVDFDAMRAEEVNWTTKPSPAEEQASSPSKGGAARLPWERETEPEEKSLEGASVQIPISLGENSASIQIETVLSEEPASDPALPTVLVVDVSDSDRQAVRSALKGYALKVREAGDGDAALSVILNERPALLILDPALPGLHGFELCQRIHEDPDTQSVATIIVSGVWRGWRVAADLRELYGVSAFLDKPFKPERLAQAVSLALGLEVRRNGTAARAAAALNEAMAEQKAGKLTKAVEHMREAVRLDPFSASARSQLAALLLRDGRAFEAMQMLEEAAELDPASLAILRNLASLYEKRGFRGKAVEAWERALRAAVTSTERDEIRRKLEGLLR